MRRLVLACTVLSLVACDEAANPLADGGVATDGAGFDGSLPTSACSGWTLLSDFYPDVTYESLHTCDTAAGTRIEQSLMRLSDITIDGERRTAIRLRIEDRNAAEIDMLVEDVMSEATVVS